MKPRAIPVGHAAPVHAVAFRADGKLLASDFTCTQ
jgi:hypothetical protein